MLTQTFRTTDEPGKLPRAFTLIHYAAGAFPLAILHDGRRIGPEDSDRLAELVETPLTMPKEAVVIPPVTLNPTAWKAILAAQPSWPVAAWNALVTAAGAAGGGA